MASYRPGFDDNSSREFQYLALFSKMTPKQHEVYTMVAEGRSSKEIAWRLDITESAVNQRIEAVRSRAGSPPRAELARAYRAFSAVQLSVQADGQDDLEAVGRSALVPAVEQLPPQASGASQATESRMSRALASSELIVPQAFVGPNAELNRLAAMVVIAAGLLTTAMVGLSVVQALAAML